jgi:condensation enzyme
MPVCPPCGRVNSRGPSGDMVGSAKFNRLDFDQSTIIAMIDEYWELLRASLKSPDSPLPR